MITAAADKRHFTTSTQTTLTIRYIGLTGGNVAGGGEGGSVLVIAGSTTKFIAIESTIYGNTGRYGGGVRVHGGEVVLHHSSIASNTACCGKCGGGVYADGGSLTLVGSSIKSNNAGSQGWCSGGGLCVFGAATLIDTSVEDNISPLGAGAYTTSNSFTVSDCIFRNNGDSTTTKGGGVYSKGTSEFSRVRFEDNTATDGAGIYGTASATITLSSSWVNGNHASSRGGGVYSSNKV